MMGQRARMLCIVGLAVCEDVCGRVDVGDTRTGVDGSYVLERAEQQHEHDPHAENLNTASGHVQHERLHRKRFGG